jgi:hypothetical protein
VESSRDDLHRRLRRRFQRSIRTEVGRNTGRSPGIEFAVCPDETGGVLQSPAFSVFVYLVFVVVRAECAGICVAVRGWEEDGALTLPVFRVNEARCEGCLPSRSPVLPVIEWLCNKLVFKN